MRILVDSNALIELFRGSAKGRKVRDLMGANEVVLSPICTFEVLSVIGRVHSKKKAEEFQRSLAASYRSFPVDDEVAQTAADIKRKHGMPMADSLIYATAKLNRAKVLSGCRHFKRLRREKDVMVL